VDFSFELLEYYDILTWKSGGVLNKQWVWSDAIDEAGILSPEQIVYSANTGLIVSSKRFATSIEELIVKARKEALPAKHTMSLLTQEQPLLNYLIVTNIMETVLKLICIGVENPTSGHYSRRKCAHRCS
jgi:hypothetical protein